jgi:hypothetical protein
MNLGARAFLRSRTRKRVDYHDDLMVEDEEVRSVEKEEDCLLSKYANNV